MASQPVKEVIRQVKPLLSSDSQEARKRVIYLYKTWYRQIPPIIVEYKVPITVTQARKKLKEEFLKNKDVKDIRVIDMLVIKGQMEFKEVMLRWKQKCHLMYYFKDTQITPPSSFMSKFLAGSD